MFMEHTAVVYSAERAPGAIENETRVRKVNSEPGDGHRDGVLGTIVGSWGPWTRRTMTPSGPKDVRYAYFVKWDGCPLPVATLDYKVEALALQ